jgi:hypothetical protein
MYDNAMWYPNRMILARLVVNILLNERDGFRRAGLNRTPEGFRVAGCLSKLAPDVIRFVTYLLVIVPDEAWVISISFPTTLEISNTASDSAVGIHTEASARWRLIHRKQETS